MNVVKGNGKVHYNGNRTEVGSGACNPWKGVQGFKLTSRPVTCAKCLTYMAKEEARNAETVAQMVRILPAAGNGVSFIGRDAEGNTYDLDADKQIIRKHESTR